MTLSWDKGYSDTAIGGETQIDVTVPQINWASDYRVAEDGPGVVILDSLTAPIDRPHIITFKHKRVSNVYAGTDIPSGLQLDQKAGSQLWVESRSTWEKSSSTDETYSKFAPFRTSMAFTYPLDSDVEAIGYILEASRVLSAVLTDTNGSGLSPLLRGILNRGL